MCQGHCELLRIIIHKPITRDLELLEVSAIPHSLRHARRSFSRAATKTHLFQRSHPPPKQSLSLPPEAPNTPSLPAPITPGPSDALQRASSAAVSTPLSLPRSFCGSLSTDVDGWLSECDACWKQSPPSTEYSSLPPCPPPSPDAAASAASACRVWRLFWATPLLRALPPSCGVVFAEQLYSEAL